jgi:hypothetical protein
MGSRSGSGHLVSTISGLYNGSAILGVAPPRSVWPFTLPRNLEQDMPMTEVRQRPRSMSKLVRISLGEECPRRTQRGPLISALSRHLCPGMKEFLNLSFAYHFPNEQIPLLT